MPAKFSIEKAARRIWGIQKVIIWAALTAVLMAAAACQGTVEVTREVEVTRRVQVTRVVTATPRPTPTPPADWGELKDAAYQTTYANLYRNNEDFVGLMVYYEGRVYQALEARDWVLASVTRNEYSWEDNVLLRGVQERYLKGDFIEFVGVVTGLHSYEAISGAPVTVPEISIVQLRGPQ